MKRKFLVDFPEDFYQFWEFCSSLDPTHPESESTMLMTNQVSEPSRVLSSGYIAICTGTEPSVINFLYSGF